MKTMKILTYGFLSVLFIVSCSQGPDGQKAETGEKQESQLSASGTEYAISHEESKVHWTGTKPTGEHYGIVGLKDGYLMLEDGQISGGNFVIDMTSIQVDDLEDPEMNQKLTGHLKSEDFFEVESYPTATFEITNVEPAGDVSGEGLDDGFEPDVKITGNLTMKDSTKSVSFYAAVDEVGDNLDATSNTFIIDRSEWNVRYGSRSFFDDLQDQFIYDDIALKIDLSAEKK